MYNSTFAVPAARATAAAAAFDGAMCSITTTPTGVPVVQVEVSGADEVANAVARGSVERRSGRCELVVTVGLYPFCPTHALDRAGGSWPSSAGQTESGLAVPADES